MHRTQHKLLALLALLLWTAQSNASNWVSVSDGGSFKVSVDVDSIRGTGARVKAWTNYIYEKPAVAKDSTPPKYYMSMKALSIYNCIEMTNAQLQVLLYADTEGEEVIQHKSFSDMPERYRDSVPDSVGEAIFNFVCKRAASSAK